MRYNHYIFTLFLIAASVCSAMDNQGQNLRRKLDIIGEITVAGNPYKVRCLEGDRAVIWSGMNAFIVDFKKNEKIKELNFFERTFYEKINVFPANKSMPFFSDHMAFLENAESEIGEWYYSKRWVNVRSISFSTHEKALYFCQGYPRQITKYNYETKQYNNIDSGVTWPLPAMHPKEKIMCVADGKSKNIALYNIDGTTLNFIKDLTPSAYQGDYRTSQFCRYSSDGSYIVVAYDKDIIIIDHIKNDYWVHSRGLCGRQTVVFHPNGSVLTNLFDTYTSRLLRCWDLKTRQVICTLELDFDAKAYDISSDGLEFIIAGKDKCIRAAVPFEVRYHGTKKSLLYHLFLLKELLNKQQDVPQDINKYCAELLLHLLKR